MTAKQEMRVLVALIPQPFVAAVAAFALFPALDAAANAAGVYRGRLTDPTGAAIAVALATAFAAVPVSSSARCRRSPGSHDAVRSRWRRRSVPARSWAMHRRPSS